MRKRALGVKSEKLIAEESAFVVGSLVQYYFEGNRYARVEEVEIDDDGDLKVKVIAPRGRTKYLWFKTKDVELMPEKR